MHACMHAGIHVSMHACMYVSMYACMYVCVCDFELWKFSCMHACMNVCTNVCMCVTLNFGNSGKIIFAKQDVKYSNNRCKISNVDGQVQNEARPLRCLGTAQGPPFMDRLS